MNKTKLNDLIQSQGKSGYRTVSPDPNGNRAQRRAWKKLTKKNGSNS